MNRREFAMSTLSAAGLSGVVSEIGNTKDGDALLLTYPYGHCQARQNAMDGATILSEKFGCDVYVIPDILKLERISSADAEEIIRHIVRISKI